MILVEVVRDKESLLDESKYLAGIKWHSFLALPGILNFLRAVVKDK